MQYSYYVGIDVSLRTLTVVILDASKHHQPPREFSNDRQGHRRLVRALQRLKASVHACLEPTNVYHLALASALHEAEGITVSVISTSAARHFAQAAMKRAKTDRVDALTLAQYAQQHEPPAWQPPRAEAMELRSISRLISSLVRRQTALKCQLHSAQRGQVAVVVIQTLKAELRTLQGRIKKLRHSALALIKADRQFTRWYQLLLSMDGIGAKTAIYILGEVGVLPSGLTKKQWVAMAGLDPLPRESGSSVDKPRRISKQGGARLRRALFLPASIAARCCPQIGVFCARMQEATGSKLSALCVVMRKMLQAIWGMFHYDQTFNPALFSQKT
jgi:transposase